MITHTHTPHGYTLSEDLTENVLVTVTAVPQGRELPNLGSLDCYVEEKLTSCP